MIRKLYTTPFCWYCERVKEELDRLGLPYEEVTVGGPAGREEVIRLSGQRRVPVLVEGDRVMHDSVRIVAHLRRSHSPEEQR